MALGLTKFASGIVVRLRLVFAAILLVISLALLLCLGQLNAITSAQHSLVVRTVPVFVATQLIERHLQRLISLMQNISSTRTVADLNALGAQIEAEFDRVQSSIATQMTKSTTPETALLMQADMDDIELDVTDRIGKRRAYLRLETLLDDRSKTLENIRRDVSYLLEEQSINNLMTFQEALGNAAHFDASLGRIGNETIFKNIRLTKALAEITLEFENFINTIQQVRGNNTSIQLTRSTTLLRRNIHTIVQDLSLLPVTPTRAQLAEHVETIQSMLWGPQGIITQVENHGLGKTALLANFERQQKAVTEISELADILTQKARQDVTVAGADLTQAIQNMIITLAISALIVAGLVIVATLEIIERQINQRMAHLTAAVLDIADGNTACPVHVSGNDELGRIAEALEVFKQNAGELRRSNEELEKFAYVASHDLRSPLRAIRDLAEWTIEDEDNQLSQDSKEYLDLLLARIARLSNLLADLLDYSRVGRASSNPSVANPAEIVRETVEMANGDGRFEVEYVGIDRDVMTYVTPLQQILLNLISNAIKHHDRNTGLISVEISSSGNGRLHVAVEDDGPGIDTAYQERVFGLFQTLRPRDDVEGSGLGLAIIRKLVEHYHGEVRLISDPTQRRGTRFELDLPDLITTPAIQKQAA